MKNLILLTLVASALAGCSSAPTPRPVGPSIDSIYSAVNQSGSRDAVDILRTGMRTQQLYGQSDPYTPLRQPEIVIPIWVPAYVDPNTGNRVDGHWEHAVIQESDWELGDGDGGN